MSVECSDQPHGWNCAAEALAEIRACPDKLRRFVAEVFDQLDGLTDELLARESADRQFQRQVEREALEAQIDQLASVVAELAESMGGRKDANGRKKD